MNHQEGLQFQPRLNLRDDYRYSGPWPSQIPRHTQLTTEEFVRELQSITSALIGGLSQRHPSDSVSFC